MLGPNLLFVGFVLMHNGICALNKVDGKSFIVFNYLMGGLSVLISATNLIQGNFYAGGTGFLFCFTYLYVAINTTFKLNPIPFAWFSLFVAINAVIFGTFEGFIGIPHLGIEPDVRFGLIWYLWAVLWATGFVQDVMKKDLGTFVPKLQIFEGIFTAWIPGVLLMLNLW